jgi:hypothetical protein
MWTTGVFRRLKTVGLSAKIQTLQPLACLTCPPASRLLATLHAASAGESNSIQLRIKKDSVERVLVTMRCFLFPFDIATTQCF